MSKLDSKCEFARTIGACCKGKHKRIESIVRTHSAKKTYNLALNVERSVKQWSKHTIL